MKRVLRTPNTVNRAGPQHLITSELMSMSAKIAQAKERKEKTFSLG